MRYLYDIMDIPDQLEKLDNLHMIGADPGFQVRGAHLKNCGGRRENCWGISCEKSRFYVKKIIFFPILGGARAGCAPPPPPWIRPCMRHQPFISYWKGGYIFF